MKRIIINGAKLVPGGVMIPTHIVEQLRCDGVEIHHEPIGLGARRQQEIQGKAADIVIVDELFGLPIVYTNYILSGEVWIQQAGRVAARIVNIANEPLQERRISDDPSPYFNDFAG